MAPIVAVFQGPSLTKESYLEAVRRISPAGLRSPSDWPVPGLLVHAAGQGTNGWRVVDVWESEAAFRKFGEKLLPVLKEVGIEGEPEVYPAETFVAAGSAAR